MDIFQIIRRDSFQDFINAIDKVDINTTHDDGQNLLHHAIAYNRPDIAQELLARNININHQDKNGDTPLHYASDHSSIEIANYILEKNADPNICNKSGNNVVWSAVFNARGQYKLVQILLKANGDATIKNKSDRSALDFAKQIEDIDLISILETNKTKADI